MKSLMTCAVSAAMVVSLSCDLGCTSTRTIDRAAAAAEDEEDEPVLTGRVTREAIEEAVPDWVAATVRAQVDPAAAAALAAAPPGATVDVFLGTWCSDSRREVPRFWRVLDELGGEVPFTLSYVGVDRDKREPAELVAGRDIAFVPTFIVRRDGEEVGRIVESAPHGIEEDLRALLTGEVRGVVSGRADGAE